jgi:hypothetical protein
MFKNPLWHPGICDQSKNSCVIHALNMFVGLPLFDTWEKFLALYTHRLKVCKDKVTEDIRLRGISINHVQRLIFFYKEDLWMTPNLTHCFERRDMYAFIQRNFDFDEFFV